MTARTDDAAIAIVDHLNSERKSWSFEIVSHVRSEGEVIVLGRLTVDGTVRMAFGAASLPRDGEPYPMSALLATAANAALSRAARLFGFAFLVQPVAAPSVPQSPAVTVDVPSSQERVTQRQLGMINGLTRRKNIGRAALGSMLHDRFRKTELVMLTKREASDIIGELNGANGHAHT